MAKIRLPLPKQTEAVFKDKRKYNRKKAKKVLTEEVFISRSRRLNEKST